MCPEDESTKKHEMKGHAVLGLKASSNTEHTAFFSSESRGILATIIAIIGILLTLLVPSLSYRITIALAATVLIIVLVLIFNNKARYSLIMFLRQIDQRLAAKKTYGDKKPTNHND
jgi:hypothetical protein